MAVPRVGTCNDGNALSGAVKTAPYVTVEKFGCTCNDKPANDKKLHGGLPCSFSLSKNYPNGLDSGIIEETGVFSRKPGEKTHSEIFEHILNKALNHRMVDPNTIFIDGTHIKASANKKKFQKEQVAKAAKAYSGQLRKEIYAQRKETVERVFADAKEKHAMRYTHHRGLAAVTRWVRLKFAAMNLKKLANWSWEHSFFACFFSLFPRFLRKTHALAS